MCKVYTGYNGTSEIEHGLCACTVDNPLAKDQGLSLRTGAQTMLYLTLKTERERDIERESKPGNDIRSSMNGYVQSSPVRLHCAAGNIVIVIVNCFFVLKREK